MTYHEADPNTVDSGALAGHGPARRGEIMRLTNRASMTLILCLLALGLRARNVGAQSLVQYTPPGGPQERPESRRQELEHELEAARYHLGPVRVAPWATLRDVAYVRSLFVSGERLPSDVTATAGAGFRAYLRNGTKATWIAQVLPEYVWWHRQTARRQLNGRYSLGFAGFFNHLTVEVKAGRQQQQQIATPEVPVPTSTRNDGGELLVELRLSSTLSLFGATAVNRQNNLVDERRDPRTGQLRLLDRDERSERLGVRWRLDRRWSIALGGEHLVTDFTHQGSLDRSNSGTAPLTEVLFQGNHLVFDATAAARSLTARRGAEFVPFHGVTGGAALTLGRTEGSNLALRLYSSRNLVYSLSSLYPYFTDQRLGAALLSGFGQRTRGRLFVEGGRNSYTAFSAATPGRREDVSSYGGSLTFALRKSLNLGIDGVHSRYDANRPGESRTYSSVGVTVTLADLPLLR